MKSYTLNTIRKQIIGNNMLFQTPFGERHLFYADYTASGRGLQFIEKKMINLLKSYANSHTEDDYTGKYMTSLLQQAEDRIKEMVNAGPKGKVISIGSGTTGALLKLQQILGIYLPPVTKERLIQAMENVKGSEQDLVTNVWKQRPIVFISPYEHHTNELMWRESFSETVVVRLNSEGALDLEDLEKKLAANASRSRKKLASFSAGSNITGLRTDTYEVARICHRYDVPILFDFAAVAPYIKIDMNKDEESYFDAIVFSPHKFLGGPGTSGILIFNEALYRKDLPPTAAGGGTVDYVGYQFHDFYDDIETREKAGTPPILQTIKTALIMELKDRIGVDRIEKIEARYIKKFINGLKRIENVDLIGEFPTQSRVPIISFNLRHNDRYLHPKFVTKLLNDLFGIQSRAGCSCAAPYGHYLLGIDDERSAKFRKLVADGFCGIKPGWVRVNLHYTFEEKDIDFLVKSIAFIAEWGPLFLKEYRLNIATAEWQHIIPEKKPEPFSLDNEFETRQIDLDQLDPMRASYFTEATRQVKCLQKKVTADYHIDSEEIEAVKFFHYIDN